jgi:hypothetical protein
MPTAYTERSMWRTMNAQARIAIERALLSDEEWEKIAEIAMPMALKNPTLDLGTYTSGDGYLQGMAITPDRRHSRDVNASDVRDLIRGAPERGDVRRNSCALQFKQKRLRHRSD